jgi:hypothetical protein
MAGGALPAWPDAGCRPGPAVRHRGAVRRVLAVVVMAALVLLAVSACGSKATLPDVVGLALDRAHQKLEAVGFKNFDDRDYFEDRTALLDANWVVIAQGPAAGTQIDTDTKIQLRIGKSDEDRTLAALRDDSPVKQEAVQRQAAEAAKQAANAAQKAAESKAKADERAKVRLAYVGQIDPALRLAQNTLLEIGKLGGEVRSGKLSGRARKFVGGSGPGGGFAEVEAAGQVEGVLAGTDG